MDVMLAKVRECLKKRGANGIIGLSRNFKIMDDNHSLTLDRAEFFKAMNDFALPFSESECTALFNYFDINRDGEVSYDEFLRVIRGDMNALRKSKVMQAFTKFDKDGNGYVDIEDLRGVYNGSKHPEVMSGKKSEDQVLQEFLRTFETHHNMRNNDAPDHIVTSEEFLEYYNNVSCSIDDDQYFIVMMTNAWNLDNRRVTQGGWTNTSARVGG
jgi:Ca2+-binding EF-hand superfamily protein